VPFGAKDIKIGFANINAKAEGLENKPAFREAFRERRCLVPRRQFLRVAEKPLWQAALCDRAEAAG
jgi:putative SOS response-associated peptidase YedK